MKFFSIRIQMKKKKIKLSNKNKNNENHLNGLNGSKMLKRIQDSPGLNLSKPITSIRKANI